VYFSVLFGDYASKGQFAISLLYLFVATPLIIFGGIYGGKNALVNPRRSGWCMFLIGLIGLFVLHPISGALLIVGGIYTILFQKPSIEV
jgi:hypothetical protein